MYVRIYLYGWSTARLGRFTQQNAVCTHFTEGWVGLGACLDESGKISP